MQAAPSPDQRSPSHGATTSACPYCGARALVLTHRGLYHKVDRAFGPFDIVRCAGCGSAATRNPPSPARLAEFYTQYHLHRPQWYRRAAESAALAAQYEFYAGFLARQMPDARAPRWLDIGAGHGEVANLLAARLPATRGLAADITGRPPQLAPQVDYRSLDINAPDWLGALGTTFDLVYSVAVWEHVLDPLGFATQALSLVAPGGTLVLICPDYGSVARQMLGERWPYFEPGEHLSMPSRKGARACVARAARALGRDPARLAIACRTLWVGYSLRYLLNVLSLDRLAALLPPRLAAPLPTGLLSVVVRAA